MVRGLEQWPDAVVMSDEIYSNILYGGREHVTLLDYPQLRERLILLDGWSKTYAMTGWRLGYGVFPPALFAAAERMAINSYSCPNAATQYAAVEALEGPQDAVAEMVAAFDERRRAIVEELNAVPGVSCVDPAGAFYAFPNITGTGLDARTLQARLLQEAGVAVIAGTSFGALGEGYLRFSYAAGLEEIREGVSRMRALLGWRRVDRPIRVTASRRRERDLHLGAAAGDRRMPDRLRHQGRARLFMGNADRGCTGRLGRLGAAGEIAQRRFLDEAARLGLAELVHAAAQLPEFIGVEADGDDGTGPPAARNLDLLRVVDVAVLRFVRHAHVPYQSSMRCGGGTKDGHRVRYRL